jgi:uncharacterized membrane protein
MVQIVSGAVLLLLGALLVVRGLRLDPQERAGQQGGALGRRFGPLMLGLVLAFLGVALPLPARDATPSPGANTNPVDEAVEEGGK